MPLLIPAWDICFWCQSPDIKLLIQSNSVIFWCINKGNMISLHSITDTNYVCSNQVQFAYPVCFWQHCQFCLHFPFKIVFRKRYNFPLIGVIQRQWNGKFVILIKFLQLATPGSCHFDNVHCYQWQKIGQMTTQPFQCGKHILKVFFCNQSIYYSYNQLWKLPIYLQFQVPALSVHVDLKHLMCQIIQDLSNHLWQMSVGQNDTNKALAKCSYLWKNTHYGCWWSGSDKC